MNDVGNLTVALALSASGSSAGTRGYTTSAIVGVMCVLGIVACIAWASVAVAQRAARERERTELANAITMIDEEQCESADEMPNDPNVPAYTSACAIKESSLCMGPVVRPVV
tara:strand:+ start:652 stop:987 length:336 start_codon:yes stop_codon:yes gene_type:complete